MSHLAVLNLSCMHLSVQLLAGQILDIGKHGALLDELNPPHLSKIKPGLLYF